MMLTLLFITLPLCVANGGKRLEFGENFHPHPDIAEEKSIDPSPVTETVYITETVIVDSCLHGELADKARISDCKCDEASLPLTKIINGEAAEPLEFPWQAGLVNNGSKKVFCGGSLINSKWVMSAAHCTINKESANIEVLLAAHDFNDLTNLKVAVKNIINHPHYYQQPWINGSDISLLELDDHVDFALAGTKARPICLPTGTKDYLNENAIVTGWGLPAIGAEQLPYLQKVTIPVVKPKKCKSRYGTQWKNETQQICAGIKDGSGGCSGDSGGPLIFLEPEGNNYVQIGVVSFASSECITFGVYTRVTYFMDWIQNTTNTVYDTCNPY